MTALDILVLLLVGGAGFLGFSRGFVTEILSLAAWATAILAVKFLHAPTALALEERVGTAAGASVLAFALIFGLTMFLGRMVARSAGKTSKKSVIGLFDRMLGLGFGAIKGLVGASLIFLFASLMYNMIYGGGSERPDWMKTSKTYPLLHASSRAIIDFVVKRSEPGGDEKGEGKA